MEDCANCVFYEQSTENLILTGQRSHLCRRYPPDGFLVIQNNMAQFMYRQAEVKSDGWCGEWKEKTGLLRRSGE